MRKKEDGTYELELQDQLDMGMTPENPRVVELMKMGGGIGTKVPDFFLKKFLEFAGPELTAQDAAMMFQGFLHMAEKPGHEEEANKLFKFLVDSFYEFKNSQTV